MIRKIEPKHIIALAHTTKILDYCGGPKLPQKSKKPPLKVHLAYCSRGYYDDSTR